MSGLRCPYCLGELEAAVRCTTCFTPHHAACFREHGGCTQLGCEGRETTLDQGASPAPGWELHPFLVEVAADEQARFLSARVRHDPSPGLSRPPALRTLLPDVVPCGELLRGRLRAFTPRALHGRGLHLRCSLVEPPALRYEAGAVLLGGPPRGWLERVRLRGREDELLLPGGRTEVEFRFDPAPLPPRSRLPEHPRFGVYHRLEVWLELDSVALTWKDRPHRVLIRHRPGRCGHKGPRDPWPDARLR